MKVYTRVGDDGRTALFGGGRVSKANLRVQAYGAVDSANSTIGLARAGDVSEALGERLELIMSDLFDVGAELATPPEKAGSLDGRLVSAVDDRRVEELESWIDEASAELEPLTTFVLPTGSETAARLHIARAEVRRAEREVVALTAADEEVRPVVIKYLNRLSDLLFTWARLANKHAGRADTAWRARKDT